MKKEKEHAHRGGRRELEQGKEFIPSKKLGNLAVVKPPVFQFSKTRKNLRGGRDEGRSPATREKNEASAEKGAKRAGREEKTRGSSPLRRAAISH